MEKLFQDEEIQKILYRAAELQVHRASEMAALPGAGPEPADQPSGGLSLRHVAQAAEEACISQDVFALAAAELIGSPGFQAVPPEKAKKAMRWLGHEQRFFECDCIIPKAPEAVLGVLQGLLASPDYQITVSNMVGDEVFRDGIIVLEPANLAELLKRGFSRFNNDMLVADFRQLLVTIRELPGQPGQTRLAFYTSLDHSAFINYRLGLAIQWSFSAIGGLIALGALLAATRNPIVAVAASACGAGLSFLGLGIGLRGGYRRGIKKGQKAVQELLTKVQYSFKLKKF